MDTASPLQLSHPPTTDWSLCALCQEQTNEQLQCPANTTHKQSTYVSLAANLIKFSEIGALPFGLLGRLGENDGVENAFRKNKACFHLSCRLKFNSTKLKRKIAASVSTSEDHDELPQKIRRRDSNASVTSDNGNKFCCFLCDETAPLKDLRNASTFQLDEKVRKCALFLKDSKLLAKLSMGDVISQELKYHSACLISLYRRAQPKFDNEPHKNQLRHGLVFAELTEFMQEVKDTSSGDQLAVFKLADLYVPNWTARI